MYSTGVVFSIELEREDDGRWLADVPALLGVMCYGADRDEAVARGYGWVGRSTGIAMALP